MKMNYEIKKSKLVCNLHGEIDKHIVINGEPDCPHCLLQFLLSNDIDVGESMFKNTTWKITEESE